MGGVQLAERPALTGDDRIGEHRQGREQVRAHRPDVDERRGGQLEVLDEAPLEEQALAGVVRVGEGHRVSGAVEPLGVEGLGGELGAAVVAGRDDGWEGGGIPAGSVWLADLPDDPRWVGAVAVRTDRPVRVSVRAMPPAPAGPG